MTVLRVCFVGLKCYDLLARADKPRYVGGAERQQVFIGRGLSGRGHDVKFVTLDYGQADGIRHDGITVFKAYDQQAGAPGVRFFHPRWTGLTSALKRANADIYYQMGADSETGQIAAWCRWQRRGFVFATASDSDCERGLPRLRQFRRRALYRYGLGRADRVIAQTTSQQEKLRESFAIEANVIRNCTGDPGWTFTAREEKPAGTPRLLWVGRFVPVKRLEVLLDLAASRPAWTFHIVGGGTAGDEYVQGLERRAAALPNVTRHQGLSDADLHHQYLLADALLCTSSWEGVPTTFLEAWARGLAVVSTVDPDNVVARFRLGRATTVDGLADGIEALQQEDRKELANRVRQHFVSTHTIEASVAAHEALFEELYARFSR